MERAGAHSGKRWLPRLLFIVALSATPWLLVVYCHLSVFHGAPHASAVTVTSDAQRFLLQQEERLDELPSASSGAFPATTEEERHPHGDDDNGGGVDACQGRYVYIHDLPPRFNEDILAQCRVWYPWINMCVYLANAGLGQPVNNSDGVFADRGGTPRTTSGSTTSSTSG
jgi:xyloglucan galactosyltransferase MUR3